LAVLSTSLQFDNNDIDPPTLIPIWVGVYLLG
jgi:hypothetical protein